MTLDFIQVQLHQHGQPRPRKSKAQRVTFSRYMCADKLKHTAIPQLQL